MRATMLRIGLTALIAMATLTAAVSADTITIKNQTIDSTWDDGSIWIGGVAPGVNDTAQFNNPDSPRTITLTSDVQVYGMNVVAGWSQPTTIAGNYKLTIGAGGMLVTHYKYFTMSAKLAGSGSIVFTSDDPLANTRWGESNQYVRILTGDNSDFTGTITTTNYGSLIVGNNNAVPSGATLVLGTGGVVAANNGNFSIAAAVRVEGNTQLGGRTSNYPGSLDFTNTVTLMGDYTLNQRYGPGGTGTGDLVTFSGSIVDGGSGYGLTIAGGNWNGGTQYDRKVVFSGSNTYTGTTLVTNGGGDSTGGYLQLKNNHALDPNSALTITGSDSRVEIYNDISVTIKGLTIAGVSIPYGTYNQANPLPSGGSYVTFMNANSNLIVAEYVAPPSVTPDVLSADADNYGVGGFTQAGAELNVTGTSNHLVDWGSNVANYIGAGGNPVNAANKGQAIFLAGDSTSDPTLSWRSRTVGEADEDGVPLVSDVVDITGLTSAAYVLQLKYDDLDAAIGDNEDVLAAAGKIHPVYFNGSEWVNAGSTFVDGAAPTSNLVAHLGEWGIDTDANTVWVVLDHASQFAVVPEPATMAFLTLGGLAMAGAAIRRRRGA